MASVDDRETLYGKEGALVEENNYELRPVRRGAQKPQAEPAPELSQTAFRCGSWSLRGPKGPAQMGWRDTALGVVMLSAFGAFGLVLMALPLVAVTGLLYGLIQLGRMLL